MVNYDSGRLLHLNQLLAAISALVFIQRVISNNFSTESSIEVKASYLCMMASCLLHATFYAKGTYQGIMPFYLLISEALSSLFLLLSYYDPEIRVVWIIACLYITLLVQIPLSFSTNRVYSLVIIAKPIVIGSFEIITTELKLIRLSDILSIFLVAYLIFKMTSFAEKEFTELYNKIEELTRLRRQAETLYALCPVGMILVAGGQAKEANENALGQFQCASISELNLVLSKLACQEIGSSNPSLLEAINNYIDSGENGVYMIHNVKFDERLLQLNVQLSLWNGCPAAVVALTEIAETVKTEISLVENHLHGIVSRSVSHEFKTEINALMYNLQSVASDINLPKKSLKILSAAGKNSIRLLKSTYNLIDYFSLLVKKFRLVMTHFDIPKIIEECADLITPLCLQKSVKFSCLVDPNLPREGSTDRVRLKQVLIALLKNAVKHTPKRGNIHLKATLNDSGMLEVTVSDNGVGLNPQELLEMQETFGRKEISYVPTRVSMDLQVSGIVAQFLGLAPIKVESILSEGSSFTFQVDIKSNLIAIYSASSMDLGCIDELSDPIQIHPWRYRSDYFPSVIIVDDTCFNRQIVADLLGSAGIECGEFESGQEAIEYVIGRANAGKPVEVVIMDFDMPTMNGPTTCRKLLKLLSEKVLHLPNVIAHTAYTSTEDKQECFDAGMVAFLPKPSDKETLISTVKSYL